MIGRLRGVCSSIELRQRNIDFKPFSGAFSFGATGATSIGWNPLTQPHAGPEKSLEFCEILYASGRRSPENRSQGLRPPWGVHASPRRSGEAGRGGNPQREPSSGQRRTPRAGGWDARGGLGRKTGGIAGKARAYSGKKPGCRGQKRACLSENGAQRARFGRPPGRSAGRKPGKPGGHRAETAAFGGAWRENSGTVERKRRGFGAVGGKKGRKKPPRGGVRAENGAEHGIFRTACDGFTLFFDPAHRTRSPSRLYR